MVWGSTGKQSGEGAVAGTLAAGPMGTAYGAANGSKVSNFGETLDKKFFSGDWEAKAADAKKQQDIEDQRKAAEQGYMTQQAASDQAYQNQSQDYMGTYQKMRDQAEQDYLPAEQQYQADLKAREGAFTDAQAKLRNEAESQATDANATYTNSIKPKMQGLMDQAYKNAQDAMSLSDAGDPNNKVATAYRDLYQNTYNKEAQGLQAQGYQNYGVLSALGAQASQYGAAGSGAPMTVGQQMASQATNQRAAGEAFANTQQRMNALRQTGIEQGLQAGRDESAAQYSRGVSAQQLAAQQANNFQNAQGLNLSQQQGLRGEQAGYGQNILGSQSRVGESALGIAQSDYGRTLSRGREDLGMEQGLTSEMKSRQDAQRMLQMQQSNQSSTFDQSMVYQQMLQQQQDLAARQAALTGGMQTAGTVAGSMFGGPAGGAAGGAAGKATGGMMTGGGANAAPPPPNAGMMAPQYAGSQQYSPYQNNGVYGRMQA